MNSKPLILLSNDDGYFSRGIRALRAALSRIGDVVTVAPETEQSAASHALTLHRPLRLRSVEPGVFAVDGTPADCVYVALHSTGRVLPRKPDVVVSGLNHGLNLGQDAFYSGTVAAAREAALRGIPSLACSAHPKVDFEAACALCAEVTLGLHGAPASLVSVNFPPDWLEKGRKVKPTRLGTRIYEELLDFRKDPRGREYFWLGGPGVRHEEAPGTDTDAYDQGIASISALILDLTDERPETSRLVDALARRGANLAKE